MGFLFSLLIVFILFKITFFIGSGILKIIFFLIGIGLILAILPVSLVLLVPIGILLVLLSLFIGLLQWIL